MSDMELLSTDTPDDGKQPTVSQEVKSSSSVDNGIVSSGDFLVAKKESAVPISTDQGTASEIVRRAYFTSDAVTGEKVRGETVSLDTEGSGVIIEKQSRESGTTGPVTSSTQYDPVHYVQWYYEQQLQLDDDGDGTVAEGAATSEKSVETPDPVVPDPSFAQLPPNYDLFSHLTPMKPQGGIARTPSTRSDPTSSPALGFASRGTPVRGAMTPQQQQQQQQRQQRAGFLEQLLQTAITPAPNDSCSQAGSSSTQSVGEPVAILGESPTQLVQAYHHAEHSTTPSKVPKATQRSPGTDIKARPFVPMHQRADSEKDSYDHQSLTEHDNLSGPAIPEALGEEESSVDRGKEVSLGSSFPEPTPAPTEPSTTGSDQTNSSQAPTLIAALNNMVGSFHASVRKTSEELVLPFSHELEHFVDTFLVLNQQQKEAREGLIALVQQVVKQVLTPEEGSEVVVKVHGSFPSGLSLVSSDVDFLVTGYADAPRFALDRVAAAFAQYDAVKGSPVQQAVGPMPYQQQSNEASQTIQGECYDVTSVPFTRVPVVKIVDKSSFLRADISFGGGDNEASMAFTSALVEQHQPQCRRLILLLKYLVKECRFGETERGGVTSFVLALLISHFFQEREKMQKEEDQQLEQHIQQQHMVETVASFLPPPSDDPNSLQLPPTCEQEEATGESQGKASPAAKPLERPPLPLVPPTPPTTACKVESATSSRDGSLPPTDNLGRLFLEFCSYWGSYFDYLEWGVHFDTETLVSSIVRKPDPCRHRGQHLHLMSPFGAGYDVTARMHLTREVQISLYHCLTALAKEMNLSSLLSVVAAHGGWVPNSQFLVMHHQHQLISQQWEYHQQQMYAVAAGSYRGRGVGRGRGAARGRGAKGIGKPPSFQDPTRPNSGPATPTFGATPPDGRGSATPPVEGMPGPGAYESVGTMTAPMVFPPPPFRVNQAAPNYVQPPAPFTGQKQPPLPQQQSSNQTAGFAPPAGLGRVSMGQHVPQVGYGGPPSPSMVPVSSTNSGASTTPPNVGFPTSYQAAMHQQGNYPMPPVQSNVHQRSTSGGAHYYRERPVQQGAVPLVHHSHHHQHQHGGGHPVPQGFSQGGGLGVALVGLPQAPPSVPGSASMSSADPSPTVSNKPTVMTQSKKETGQGKRDAPATTAVSTPSQSKKKTKSESQEKKKSSGVPAEPVALPSMGDAPALPTTTPNHAPPSANKWARSDSGKQDQAVSAASLVRGTPPKQEEVVQAQEEVPQLKEAPVPTAEPPAPVKQLFQARNSNNATTSPPPSSTSGGVSTKKKTGGGAMFHSSMGESGSLFSRLSDSEKGPESSKETKEEKSPWDRPKRTSRDDDPGGSKSKKEESDPSKKRNGNGSRNNEKESRGRGSREVTKDVTRDSRKSKGRRGD